MSKVVKYFCDECGRQEQHIHNWIGILELDLLLPSSHRVNDREKIKYDDKDFCSSNCLLNFVKKSLNGSIFPQNEIQQQIPIAQEGQRIPREPPREYEPLRQTRREPSEGVEFNDYQSQDKEEFVDEPKKKRFSFI